MALAPEYYTADMVRALPEDGQRYECVHGELLVTPAPSRAHQRVVRGLMVALVEYCERFHHGEVLSSPAALSWEADSLVQPDVFVVAAAEANGRDWTDIRTLDLVAEVLSPSTAKYDRFQKRKLYQRNGVRTLWLIDLDRQRVEVWTPDAFAPVFETERLTWHPDGAAEPLVIPISSLLSFE